MRSALDAVILVKIRNFQGLLGVIFGMEKRTSRSLISAMCRVAKKPKNRPLSNDIAYLAVLTLTNVSDL